MNAIYFLFEKASKSAFVLRFPKRNFSISNVGVRNFVKLFGDTGDLSSLMML